MIKTFVINLDESVDRMKNVSLQLDNAKLTYEKVSAFDGRGMDLSMQTDLDREACIKFMGRPLRGGEYGCYKSHLKCAQRIVDEGLKYALVLEDDIVLSEQAAEIIAETVRFLEATPSVCDVVHLSADRIKFHTPIGKVSDEHALVAANYFPMTTSALLWTFDGAKRFLEENSIVRMPVDHQLRETLTRSGRGFAVWPAIASQTGQDSDIDGEAAPRRNADRRWNYGLLKQRRLLANKSFAFLRLVTQKAKVRKGHNPLGV